MSEDLKPKNLPNDTLDIDVARANLARMGPKRQWQSLEELADTKLYRQFLQKEFQAAAPKEPDGIQRRDVLKLMAASAALAGLSACTKLPTEKIVPYVHPPEDIIPGRPLFYATSMPQAGGAIGLLVESHIGRPTKIEGNPQHPGSLGATDALQQASILNMYDPDRSQSVTFNGHLSSWADFVTAVSNVRAHLGASGKGLYILTKTVTSPTLGSQMQSLLAQYPAAKWHQYEPCGLDSLREGARLAFGRPLNTVLHVDQADVIVSLDADFLMTGPGHVRHIHDFSMRRSLPDGPKSNLNRLYVVESMPTSTGAMADHRLPLRSIEVEDFTRQLAAALGVSAASGGTNANVPADWLKAVAEDLMQHRGSSLVVAGEQQPPIVHALAHAINAALGNLGKTVTLTESIEAQPVNQLESLKDLVNDLNAGKVAYLLILGTNPVYDAPADLDFKGALAKAKLSAHAGLYADETARWCHWHVPATHYLESWSDARAYDGTTSMVQPLIAPLYDSHSDHEIIAVLSGQAGMSSHDLLRAYWQSQRPEKGKAFDDFWEVSLYEGFIANSALPAVSVPLKSDFLMQPPTKYAGDPNALEVVFRPDPSIGDGQWNNNSWLQELPKPITRLTWDNAAMVSPATAQKLGIASEDYVMLELGGRKVGAPVFVTLGHADNSITAHFGYGRTRTGSVGEGTGFDAYSLRTLDALTMARGLQITKTGKQWPLAMVQHQYTIDVEGHAAEQESVNSFQRDLVQIASLDEFRKDPTFAKVPDTTESRNESLYPNFPYTGYAWAMSIDLNRCVGCNACVIACQSENNIAVVGKEQVIAGRVMHWIRIDTYFRGSLENPEMFYEPLPCMQCENAPCEYVCPVGATTHTPEGLNDMTYNRCVGTRYCSNNCPWKVRRFNFFLYSDYTTPSLYGVRNPDVTVRSRGVMEKCTYCVQRIQEAKIHSTEENRKVRDGEIQTACQQVCPANAIVFGDKNDPNSHVSRLMAQQRDYVLLAELNTRPRTSYLARVRNPNPVLEA